MKFLVSLWLLSLVVLFGILAWITITIEQNTSGVAIYPETDLQVSGYPIGTGTFNPQLTGSI